MNVIPVMHCFDDRYVIPASVAFQSMLTFANPDFFYKLYVCHSDISEEHQKKLCETVSKFKNASLDFIDMHNHFSDVFLNTKTKGHYSEEMYYKLLAASIFPQYDKIIVSDVDVVYQGDISASYTAPLKGIVAGVSFRSISNSVFEKARETYKDFSEDEFSKLKIGAGYLIFNLKKIREEGIENKFLSFLNNNLFRLRQPEQDIINMVCFPDIDFLPMRFMLPTYLYDCENKGEDSDLQELQEAFINPVQIHYATKIKPWNKPSCLKSELWYEFLLKTSFFTEQMIQFDSVQKLKGYLFGILPVVSIKNLGLKKQIKFLGIKLKTVKK